MHVVGSPYAEAPKLADDEAETSFSPVPMRSTTPAAVPDLTPVIPALSAPPDNTRTPSPHADVPPQAAESNAGNDNNAFVASEKPIEESTSGDTADSAVAEETAAKDNAAFQEEETTL